MSLRVEGSSDSNYPRKPLQRQNAQTTPASIFFNTKNNSTGEVPPDPTDVPDDNPSPSGGEPVVPPDPTETPTDVPDDDPPPSGGTPVPDPTPDPTGINNTEVNSANTNKTQKRMLKAGTPLPQGDNIKIYDMSGKPVTGTTADRSGMYIIKYE